MCLTAKQDVMRFNSYCDVPLKLLSGVQVNNELHGPDRADGYNGHSQCLSARSGRVGQILHCVLRTKSHFRVFKSWVGHKATNYLTQSCLGKTMHCLHRHSCASLGPFVAVRHSYLGYDQPCMNHLYPVIVEHERNGDGGKDCRTVRC